MPYTKYKNRVVTIDGHCFPSAHEAARYRELRLLARARQIDDLRMQVKFVLIPAQYEGDGRKRRCIERECTYIADFVYIENGKTIVEDAKGVRTKDYIIKRKLMLFIHHIRVREV